MSVDRYLAITQCFKLSNVSDGNAWHRTLLATVWLISLAIFSPLLAVAVLREEKVPIINYNYNTTMVDEELVVFCTEDWPSTSMSRSLFGVFSFILVYAIPGLIMVVAYSLMGRKLWSFKPSFDKENSDLEPRQSLRLVKERKRIAWILLLIAVLFAVCWLPYNTIQLLLDTNYISSESVSGIMPYTLFIGHANSAINPIVYCIMTRKFRHSLKKLLCKQAIDLASRQQQRYNIRCVAGQLGTSSSGYDSYHEPHRKCYLQMNNIRPNLQLDSTAASQRTGVAGSQVTYVKNSRRLMHAQAMEILNRHRIDKDHLDFKPQQSNLDEDSYHLHHQFL